MWASAAAVQGGCCAWPAARPRQSRAGARGVPTPPHPLASVTGCVGEADSGPYYQHRPVSHNRAVRASVPHYSLDAWVRMLVMMGMQVS